MEAIQCSVHEYYQGWINKNAWQVRQTLAPNFMYRTKSFVIDVIDDFFEIFKPINTSVKAVNFLKEVYHDNEAMIVAEFEVEKDKCVSIVEYFHFENGKIKEIVVVNDDPIIGVLFQ